MLHFLTNVILPLVGFLTICCLTQGSFQWCNEFLPPPLGKKKGKGEKREGEQWKKGKDGEGGKVGREGRAGRVKKGKGCKESG